MTASAVPADGALTFRSARSTGGVLTAGEVAAFFLGVTTWLEIQLFGRIYLGELGLAVCAVALPVLWGRVRRRGVTGRRVLAWYIALFVIYFVGLILTDLYRGSSFSDYARGWARALFLFTNTIGLLVIGYDRPRQLLAWIAGQAISGLIVVGIGYAQYGMIFWKFGLAVPVTVGLLLLTDSRRTAWAISVLLGLGTINLLLDYRSLALFCCAASVLVYLKNRRTQLRGIRLGFRAVVFALVVGGGLVALYSSGLVFRTVSLEGKSLGERRRDSNIERLAGFVIGVQAIRESPVVGYGSWARSSNLFVNWVLLQQDLGSSMGAEGKVLSREEAGLGDSIPTHSQLLQAWVEAGIPGLIFFLFLLVAVIRLLRAVIRRPTPERSAALVALWGVWVLWAILLSPFGGFARLYNAIAFAILFVFAVRPDPTPILQPGVVRQRLSHRPSLHSAN